MTSDEAIDAASRCQAAQRTLPIVIFFHRFITSAIALFNSATRAVSFAACASPNSAHSVLMSAMPCLFLVASLSCTVNSFSTNLSAHIRFAFLSSVSRRDVSLLSCTVCAVLNFVENAFISTSQKSDSFSRSVANSNSNCILSFGKCKYSILSAPSRGFVLVHTSAALIAARMAFNFSIISVFMIRPKAQTNYQNAPPSQLFLCYLFKILFLVILA